jgi:hypothetical protein
MQKRLLAALVATAILGWNTQSQAAAVILQQGVNGYSGMTGATLSQTYPESTLGYQTDTLIGVGSWIGASGSTAQKGLIRFDLSSLAGQTITSASLTLTSDQIYLPGNWGGNLTLYRVSDANKGWVVGGYASPPVNNGWATWGNLSANASGSPVPWAGSAGLGTSGTDYFATPLATVAFSGTNAGVATYTFNFDDVSFLADWASNPSNNAGFLLRLPETESLQNQGVYFGSSSYATVASRPELSIGVVPEPSTVSMLGLVAAAAILRILLRRRRA